MMLAEALKRPLDGPHYRERTARLEDQLFVCDATEDELRGAEALRRGC